MPDEPQSLSEAVESGDVLAMLKAQRRLIADSLLSAAENTRPQFNNELNKLHNLIATEEARLAAIADEEAANDEEAVDEAFDPGSL